MHSRRSPHRSARPSRPPDSVRLSRRELAAETAAFLRSLRRHRPETRGTYTRVLREFTRWHMRDRTFRFRPSDVERYRRYLRGTRRLSPVSVATYLTAVRRLCEFLVAKGTLRANPARGVTSYQRPQSHAHAPLSPAAVEQLLASVRGGDELSLRDAVLIRLMLYCALTESEVVRANVGDVNSRGGTLVVQGKGRRGKDAAVSLPRTVRASLDRYFAVRARTPPDAPLVVTAGNSSRGRRMTTRAVRDRVNMYLQECGIRRGPGDSAVAAYSLRLTAALLLRDNGATPEEIRQQLRLGTLTTARLYLNARPLAAGKARPAGNV